MWSETGVVDACAVVAERQDAEPHADQVAALRLPEIVHLQYRKGESNIAAYRHPGPKQGCFARFVSPTRLRQRYADGQSQHNRNREEECLLENAR